MTRRFTLVLGMHRSGTSALAGALHRLGAGLGGALVPAAEDNPGGYFENAAMVAINEALLLALERGWDDPRPLPADWLASTAAAEATSAITRLLDAEFAEDAWHVLKDPRLCRLLALWLPILSTRGQVEVLFALRSPDAVVASLRRRDRMPAEQGFRLFVVHLAEAERASRALDRASADFDRLLQSPVDELQRLSARFGWPTAAPGLVEAAASTLDAGQRNHRPEALVTPEPPLRAEALALHAALLALRPAASMGPDAALLEAASVQCPADANLEGLRWALLRERRLRAGLEASLARTDVAYAEAERQALVRLSAIAALDVRLAAAHTGLQAAEALAMDRLDELKTLAAALETSQALARRAIALQESAEADRLRAESEVAELRADLQAMRSSRTWRWTAPLRRLAAWLRSLRA